MSYLSRLLTSSRNRIWHITTTVCLCLGIVAMGIYYELGGPTLPDLKDKVGANYEEVSRVFVCQNAAFLVSCFLGGYVADKYRRHIGLTLFLTQMLVCVMTCVMTWSRVLWLLATLYFIQGLGIGPLAAGGNAWIMWMWADKAAAPNFAYHWSFGIGAFIAPQLAKPFISGRNAASQGNVTTSTSQTTVSTTSADSYNITNLTTLSTYNASEEGNIEIAYLIAGLIVGAVSVSYLVLHLNRHKIHIDQDDEASRGRHQQLPNDTSTTTAISTILSPTSCTDGGPIYGTTMVSLVFIYHFVVVGGERSWGRYLFSFVKESPDIEMSVSEMSDLQSTFWLLFFISRGVSTLLAHYVPPMVIMGVVLLLYLVNSILLAVFATRSISLLWVFCSAFGALVAPLFPGAIVIYSKYLRISAMIMALSQAGAAFGGIFFQWMSGYLLEYHSPRALLYFNIIYIILLILVFVVLVGVGTWQQRSVARLRSTSHVSVRGDDTELEELRGTRSTLKNH